MGPAAFILLFFLIGVAPPSRWGLRSALVLVLLFLFGTTLTPTPYDPDWGYDLLRAAVLWMYVTVVAGIALRVFIEAGVLGPLRPAGADRPFLAAFDATLLFGLGAWVGCLIFRALAIKLQGSDGGLALHFQVAGVAAAVAVIAPLLLRNRWSAPLIGAGLIVAALALDGGLRYPDLILSQASRVRPDQARCLMLGVDLHAPTSPKDLMVLTLPKGNAAPSAVMLLVQDNSGLHLFRWSFRARTFVTLSHNANDPRFCTPSLSNLRID